MSLSPSLFSSKISQALFMAVLLLPLDLVGQVGGDYVLGFLKFPSAVRAQAVGRRTFTHNRQDVGLLCENPALMGPDMDGKLALGFMPMRTGTVYSHAAGSFATEKHGQFGLSAEWVNFGDFDGYDASGNAQGSFSAAAYMLKGHYAVYSGPFTLGTSLGFGHERIDRYNLSLFTLDLSGLYEHPGRDFRVGLLVKNLGISPDPNLGFDRLPLDTRLGASYKLEHLPLRISAAYHHLHRFGVAHFDPDLNAQSNASGQQEPQDISTGQQVMSHLSLGGEFLFGDHLSLFLGYDHLSRLEMQLENNISLVGFSLGGEVKISYFALRVGHAWHHAAGGFTRFSLETDLKRIFYSN